VPSLRKRKQKQLTYKYFLGGNMKIQMTDVHVSKLNRRNRKKPIAKFKLEKFDNEILVSKEVY